MNTAQKVEEILIGPQPGPQTAFLSTSADIAIYGGAAGGGKSFGLLLDPLRHHDVKDYNGMIFRRTNTQVKSPGGLWDESAKLYSRLNAYPREHVLEWNFEGLKLKFGSIEHDMSVYDYQGAQIAYLGFDELTHFTEHMFFYMLSRNRSTCGVPPSIRATCNPDFKSWVRRFIDWWIGPDGYAIPERSGKIRWFLRVNDDIVWADTKEELEEKYADDDGLAQPKSITFISSNVYDNKILLAANPEYLANLKALPRVERLRLLGGNWNVTESAGMLFRREWFPVVEAIPSGWIQAIRFWDRAATKPHQGNRDPDWTRGLKLYKYPDGSFVVADLKSCRDTPANVESLIKNVASQDSTAVKIMSQQDPGSAGVAEASYFVRMLAGYMVSTMTTPKDKVTRSKPVSAQAEVGNIRVFRAPWNEEFFSELENFPEGSHDDIVDTLSGAFNELCEGLSIMDVL